MLGWGTANRYPQIVLSGSVGGIGTSFSNGADVWNVGASLAQPIFNGGALRAERKLWRLTRKRAARISRRCCRRFARCSRTAPRAIENDAQTLQARTEAATQAEVTYQIASQRFDAGGSQVALLDAERQHLQTMLDRTTSAANRYADSASLLQALGGGWWNETQARNDEIEDAVERTGQARSRGHGCPSESSDIPQLHVPA